MTPNVLGRHTSRFYGLLPMIGAAVFWGFNWPVVRIMLETCGPWTLRAAGLTGGAVVLVCVARFTGTSLAVPRAFWGDVVIASFLNVSIFSVMTVFAQLSMPTSRAAILTFTMPLWAALFAYIWLGETIDRLKQLSLLIGLAGLALLALPFWPVIAAGGVPFGLVYVLTAAICWALGTVWLKKRRIPMPQLALTVWQVGIAALACTLAMLAFEQPRLDLTHAPQFVSFLYHILLAQGVAYLLWFDRVARMAASTAALGSLLVPIFGVLGSIVLLGDWPTVTDVAGLALILSAVLLDQMRAQK